MEIFTDYSDRNRFASIDLFESNFRIKFRDDETFE